MLVWLCGKCSSDPATLYRVPSQKKHSQKITLYALHGWALGPGNAEKWRNLSDALRNQAIELNVLEIPGLDTPLSETWTMTEYVRWLGAQLPSEPCYVLGHSFGGQLSLIFANQFPQRLRGVILIDSSGIRDMSLKIRWKRALFGSLARWGQKLTTAEYARNWLYRFTREKDYLQAPPELRATMSNVLLTDVEPLLGSITTPTLILWGEHDTVTPPSMAKIMVESLPQATLRIIPDARHSPQFTHCQVVADQIGLWLRKVLP